MAKNSTCTALSLFLSLNSLFIFRNKILQIKKIWMEKANSDPFLSLSAEEATKQIFSIIKPYIHSQNYESIVNACVVELESPKM